MFTKHLLSVRHLISLILKEFSLSFQRKRGSEEETDQGPTASRLAELTDQNPGMPHSSVCVLLALPDETKWLKKKKEFTGEIRCSK